MPLNSTQEEQVAVAINDLSKKLKLERKMIVELKQFFQVMSVDMRALYAQTGQELQAVTYADDLRGILLRQNRRVSKSFSNNVVKFLNDNIKNLEDPTIISLSGVARSKGITLEELILSIRDTITLEINRMVERNVIVSTAQITRTTQKEIGLSVLKAEGLLKEELGRDPTRREVAGSSSSIFKARSNRRTGTIAATTTQGAAEGAKHIEREVFKNTFQDLDARQDGVIPPKVTEVWLTQGDSLVRDGGSGFNHLTADGQESENGIFTVSGQQLRFPGDSSLGATAGNILNCRCSAVTVIR